jgi:hypothetical protein
MVGNWEPLTFIRRRGGQSLEDVENWKLERTEQVARGLAEAGVNLVITNLHKGFGIKAEAEDIEAARRFTGFAHKHGIRVGGYIGASMMFETFFAEEPGARDWAQVDERGQPLYYNPAQTFRYMACRNNPGYQEFIRKVLRLGVQELRMDLIHFDQMESRAEPFSCRCRFCRRQFLEFLRARYTDSQLTGRFGFTRLDDVEPPVFAPFIEGAYAQLVNPLMQDWERFRAASVAQRYGEYDAYIRSLNPEVALEGNPNLNFGLNKGMMSAVDCGQLLRHGDIVWSEEPNAASWTPDGRLVSKIRSFKAVRSMGKSLFVYTGGRFGSPSPDSPPHLRLAEAMAYNDMNLGMVGDVSPTGVSLTPEARRYIDFFRAHKSVLSGTTSAAGAAVLRSFASIEFNPAESNVSTVLFEQSLIQGKVPFDIIFDRHLADLRRYNVLVLANQDALSDAQVENIRGFVAAGGGLVATGNSSLLTGWRLKRGKFALADLFGRDLPPAPGEAVAPVRRTYGKGRVVYIPTVQPSVEPPPAHINYHFEGRYWKLPRNHEELIAAVEWASAGRLAAKVAAPASVTMELVEQKSTGTLLLHLINFDFRRPVENIDVSLRVPAGFAAGDVVLESPDDGRRETLATSTHTGALAFRIPRLAVYDLAVIRLRKS